MWMSLIAATKRLKKLHVGFCSHRFFGLHTKMLNLCSHVVAM